MELLIKKCIVFRFNFNFVFKIFHATKCGARIFQGGLYIIIMQYVYVMFVCVVYYTTISPRSKFLTQTGFKKGTETTDTHTHRHTHTHTYIDTSTHTNTHKLKYQHINTVNLFTSLIFQVQRTSVNFLLKYPLTVHTQTHLKTFVRSLHFF